MTPNNARFAKFIAWPVFAVIAIGAIVNGGGNNTGNNNTGSSSHEAAASCKSDWTKCADNREMANNFDGYHKAEYACKRQATDLAKYGTPEWPWFAFGSFYPGPNTGIVTLIEPDAKFQNGFGAMAHSRVECEYDFRTEKVTNVTISAR
jgi:hypothetical protein